MQILHTNFKLSFQKRSKRVVRTRGFGSFHNINLNSSNFLWEFINNSFMSVLTKRPFFSSNKDLQREEGDFVISVQCQTSSNNMTSADELRVTTVCFKMCLKKPCKRVFALLLNELLLFYAFTHSALWSNEPVIV